MQQRIDFKLWYFSLRFSFRNLQMFLLNNSSSLVSVLTDMSEKTYKTIFGTFLEVSMKSYYAVWPLWKPTTRSYRIVCDPTKGWHYNHSLTNNMTKVKLNSIDKTGLEQQKMSMYLYVCLSHRNKLLIAPYRFSILS